MGVRIVDHQPASGRGAVSGDARVYREGYSGQSVKEEYFLVTLTGKRWIRGIMRCVYKGVEYKCHVQQGLDGARASLLDL